MTAPPENATILNTTALSNFAQVNDVELLLNLPRLGTVEAVREELKAGAIRSSLILPVIYGDKSLYSEGISDSCSIAILLEAVR